jgi:hypothetical protein
MPRHTQRTGKGRWPAAAKVSAQEPRPPAGRTSSPDGGAAFRGAAVPAPRSSPDATGVTRRFGAAGCMAKPPPGRPPTGARLPSDGRRPVGLGYAERQPHAVPADRRCRPREDLAADRRPGHRLHIGADRGGSAPLRAGLATPGGALYGVGDWRTGTPPASRLAPSATATSHPSPKAGTAWPRPPRRPRLSAAPRLAAEPTLPRHPVLVPDDWTPIPPARTSPPSQVR